MPDLGTIILFIVLVLAILAVMAVSTNVSFRELALLLPLGLIVVIAGVFIIGVLILAGHGR